ncbi:MAG: 16S rRNA (adenine(1518)-N(6)/adenine(1519)-N(6))-dimethyltransferase RsmA [Bacteroidota bacterium]|nr:16S rRNA (adenine(1518)-N(6)/adenine(1519)-N(6))-dimethyltransferase RsmA [Bacteroidota bacterium]
MVKPKKHLGQHFLLDDSVSKRIASSISCFGDNTKVLEIGPGTGALSKYLLAENKNVIAYEIDRESVDYLAANFPDLEVRKEDFLKLDFTEFGNQKLIVIGNFPYNISSQILFKILDAKELVVELVGMFQKEVALRVSQQPGNKQYGILSVLIQAYFDVEYLFTVDEHVFDPPPKVKSGVIRIKRNTTTKLSCDEKLFKRIVKTAFNQRRKMIRNSLKIFLNDKKTNHPLFTMRPEQMAVQDFIELTNILESP